MIRARITESAQWGNGNGGGVKRVGGEKRGVNCTSFMDSRDSITVKLNIYRIPLNPKNASRS